MKVSEEAKKKAEKLMNESGIRYRDGRRLLEKIVARGLDEYAAEQVDKAMSVAGKIVGKFMDADSIREGECRAFARLEALAKKIDPMRINFCYDLIFIFTVPVIGGQTFISKAPTLQAAVEKAMSATEGSRKQAERKTDA